MYHIVSTPGWLCVYIYMCVFIKCFFIHICMTPQTEAKLPPSHRSDLVAHGILLIGLHFWMRGNPLQPICLGCSLFWAGLSWGLQEVFVNNVNIPTGRCQNGQSQDSLKPLVANMKSFERVDHLQLGCFVGRAPGPQDPSHQPWNLRLKIAKAEWCYFLVNPKRGSASNKEMGLMCFIRTVQPHVAFEFWCNPKKSIEQGQTERQSGYNLLAIAICLPIPPALFTGRERIFVCS